MAEEKKEAPEKKKSKMLPIILVVILFAGGLFFGMKMGSGSAKKEEPPVELGGVESLGNEFLVNLADGRSYLRANISVQLKKGLEGEEFKTKLPLIRDSVILCLSSKTMEEVNSISGKENLKREIAYRANEVLKEMEPKKEGSEPPKTVVPNPVVPPVAQQQVINPQLPNTQGVKPSVSGTQTAVAKQGVSSTAVPSTNPLPVPPTINTAPIVQPSIPKLWEIPKEMRKYPTWDSDTGPILMVYFTDFATQ